MSKGNESAEFRKSSYSEFGDCVEITRWNGMIGVRDSKDPGGPVLWFTQTEWDAFQYGVVAGEFGFGNRAIRWISALVRVMLGVIL
ncbi:DUF397 domain-containing protein [Nocardia sp. NEAU-351]|uniref:DUF397 domain-containing protein n=1 Tax=Nocardia bovistercoris TaxID=2785916 RepID=A0A931N765_9NOCA|nr:DUF397 domain-containing protein [Nocardia bovistercoris]